MKKLEFFFMIIVVSILVTGCEKQPAKITLLNPAIDIGDVALNSKKEFYVYFKNDGEENLEILNLRPSCKCFVGKEYKLTVPPKAKDSIQVTFRAKDLGESEETLVLVSNTKPGFDLIKVKSNTK